MEPINLITYFLIVLGGFSLVWGFRWEKYKGTKREPLEAFEYLAFSTIWGSVLLFWIGFIAYLSGLMTDKNFVFVSTFPFMISPAICAAGLLIGIIGAKLYKKFAKRK